MDKPKEYLGSARESTADRLGSARDSTADTLDSTAAYLESATPSVTLREWVERAIMRLGGGSYRLRLRLAVLLTAVLGMVFLAAIGAFFSSSMELAADSEPMLTFVARLMTNFWAWGMLFLLGALFYAKMTGRMMAREAASETRFSVRTVRRLAAEARTTNGTIPIDGTTDHSKDQLKAKLLRAFSGELDLDGDTVAEESVIDTESRSVETPGLPEPDFGGALVEAGDGDVEDTTDEDDDTATPKEESKHIDRDALYEAVGVDPLNAKLSGWGEEDVNDITEAMLFDGACKGFDVAEALSAADTDAEVPAPPDPKDAVVHGLTRDEDGNLVADTESEPTELVPYEGEDATDTDETDVDEPTTVSIATRLKRGIQTLRMDLATGLNVSELAYRFGIPASLTAMLIVVLNQTLWFSVWVYPIIIAVSTLVGGVYYTGYKWRQHRRLESLRHETEAASWNTVRVLAKRVETEEITVYMAWMSGKRYADYDKARLANKLAGRWHQFLNSGECYPAIQEKFHRDIRTYDPALYYTEYGDEEDGRAAIYDDIVREVKQARDPAGIVPKDQLAERVMNRDFGLGHDPDLIAECYEDLYPEVLAEHDVDLEDTDGNEKTVTIVHLRSRRIEPELAKLRTQFAASVSADDEGGYMLPDAEQPHIPWVDTGA
ncbi:hypothetical protein [Halorubrum sp. CSM-61]|uniref:hypothetical protein n=1 Tax=Halorubrum sp. CSM-61 TaxID=2485838 RepID=UPI000F4BC49A|nr:hypothetical protein [Halorubrum sp. CSM-61]